MVFFLLATFLKSFWKKRFVDRRHELADVCDGGGGSR
jgi:hypothetical protein